MKKKVRRFALSYGRDFDGRWEGFATDEDNDECVFYVNAPTRTLARFGLIAMITMKGWKYRR